MQNELSKTYDPKKVEDKIYTLWLKNGYFNTKIDTNKKPYSIVMPPPNITGRLHMGHALDETLQDIIIRFKRMQGFCTLWVPGTDHSSIATEARIVAEMKKEGIFKDDITREEFLESAWDWKDKYGSEIINQLKKLGCSCDWQRERFTLDKGCNKAVNEVFVRLYNKGLIYKGKRIINWCPECATSISDAEVDFNEKQGNFWHIRYPFTEGSDYLVLATTRPETLLGDTAIAVHPQDERYKKYIGKTVRLPLTSRDIPVIADDYVDREFGTGVVKITPAHDPNDFEVGLRHNLPLIDIMDDNAILNENALKYKGMDRYTARKKIVKDLEEQGFIIKNEPIIHNVGECYRCNTVVEPKVSNQWFVKMDELAKPAIKSVKDNKIEFIPDRFSKIYYHWMENVKDWCISRQLWWGHRIPAWYCDDCNKIIVDIKKPVACPKCGCNNLHQDEDTLDTWFSSALWPFSVFGWPDKTDDFKFFYPTNTLITGYDIIFFWVARMIFSGIEHTQKEPFSKVFIHGLVRDANGIKMSKSLGNGIDPIELIDEFGADVLRITLATGISNGNDMRFTKEKIEASRNFANKIWNAARFIHLNVDEYNVKNELPNELNLEDKWIISVFNNLSFEITENLEKFEIGVALKKIYDFIWEYFCDWYIELTKTRLSEKNTSSQNARQILVWIFTNTLKLLHPYMPFITEEIWLTFPHEDESIMVSPYPKYSSNLQFKNAEKEIMLIIEAIRAIRNRKAEMNVPPSKKAKVYIETNFTETFEKCSEFIKKLAYASEVVIGDNFKIEGSVTAVTSDATIYMPMDELIDRKSEEERLLKELDECNEELTKCNKKLNNKGFTEKAPKNVIENVKDKAKKLNEKINMINSAIASLKNGEV